MNEAKIVECTIEKGRYVDFIWVTYDDTLTECIGTYYTDELYFTEVEFIGLTKREAQELMRQKDVAYLRS
jgi:hypothetical protein